MLLGLAAPDDAGVYRLGDDLAIVQTVDFFTPVVDDPYDFGQIAAANALSDVYATGGRPLTALNLLAVPAGKLPDEFVGRILQGGMDKIREAGAVVIGGHSIDDPEPKFGYAVTGIAHPERLLTKAAARPGDVLVLTKPIGVGVLTTAIKKADVTEAVVRRVTRVMAALNRVGERLPELGVRAATDVTGFGLLGHAAEIARESGVGLVIRAGDVPVLDEAWDYARQNLFPGGSRNNARHVAAVVDFDEALADVQRMILCDAVTSGGLLIAVPRERLDAVLALLEEFGTPSRAVIGEVTDGPRGRIRVER